MHGGCLWLLTRETPLMRAICNYFSLPLGSPWRFVIFLWCFSQTPFYFICKTVLWSSVSRDQAFHFKRSSSFGERLRCVFRMTFLGQVPHQEYNSITYLFRVHILSALYSSAGGNVGSHVPFETFFGKPRKSYHPPFHRRLEKFQLCKHLCKKIHLHWSWPEAGSVLWPGRHPWQEVSPAAAL